MGHDRLRLLTQGARGRHRRREGAVRCLGLLEHEYLEISLPRMNALIGAARPNAERSTT